MKDKVKHAFYSCTFIINPSRFPEYAKILKKVLKRTDVPLVVESRNKEHFIESVRTFCHSDYKHLLVWGGDGTAHDAINAITEELGEDSATRKKKIHRVSTRGLGQWNTGFLRSTLWYPQADTNLRREYEQQLRRGCRSA